MVKHNLNLASENKFNQRKQLAANRYLREKTILWSKWLAGGKIQEEMSTNSWIIHRKGSKSHDRKRHSLLKDYCRRKPYTE